MALFLTSGFEVIHVVSWHKLSGEGGVGEGWAVNFFLVYFEKMLPYIKYLSSLGGEYLNSDSFKGLGSNCYCLDLTISDKGFDKLSKKLYELMGEVVDIIRKDEGPEQKVAVLNLQFFDPEVALRQEKG